MALSELEAEICETVAFEYEAAIIGSFRPFPISEEGTSPAAHRLLLPTSNSPDGNTLDTDIALSYHTLESIIKLWTKSFNVADHFYLFNQGGLATPTYSVHSLDGIYLLEMKAPFDRISSDRAIFRVPSIKGYISLGYIIKAEQLNVGKFPFTDDAFYRKAYELFVRFLSGEDTQHSSFQKGLAQQLFAFSFLPPDKRNHILEITDNTRAVAKERGTLLSPEQRDIPQFSSNVPLNQVTEVSKGQITTGKDIEYAEYREDSEEGQNGKSLDWYAIVYARTFEYDYQYLALPNWLSNHQETELNKHVLATLRNTTQLYHQHRWSVFTCENAYFVGITCYSTDIASKRNQDNSGREIPIYLGYVTKGKPYSLLKQDIVQYKRLYDVIDAHWETQCKITPESFKRSIANEAKVEDIKAMGAVSNKRGYELNQAPNVVRVWHDSEENRNHLWAQVNLDLFLGKALSVCLRYPNVSGQQTFPFRNATVLEAVSGQQPKDINILEGFAD